MALITISRQMGSGGDHIASLVASMLGYRLIDKQFLINEALKRDLIDADSAETIGERKPSIIERFDEKRTKAFYAIRSIIQEFAGKDHVVIIGRGAHLELKGHTSMFNVRIIADIQKRISRVMEEQGVDKKEAKKLIKESDKQQSEYIKHFFLVNHSDIQYYDLVINTSKISDELAASLIIQAARSIGAMRIIPQSD